MNTVAEIKQFYKEHGLIARPYTSEEIEQKLKDKKIDKIPELLREYYLEIGQIKGAPNFFEYIYTLEPKDYLHIITKEDLKEEGWNDNRDYLVMGSEQYGSFNYAIALEDFDNENPPIYYQGEPFYELTKDSLYHSYDEIVSSKLDYLEDFTTTPNLMALFSYIAGVAKECKK